MAASTLHRRPGSLKDLQKIAFDGRLYAILDACDEPVVPTKVAEIGPDRAISLFRGRAEHEQWAFAPYLAKVDGMLLDWIIATLWGKPWGIFAMAEYDLLAVRKHFRRFLIVEEPDGGTMYFRYYDPRILAAFLPTCTNAELEEFFGPIKAFAVGVPGDASVELFLHIR
jgi:hypothetical protein